MSKTFAQLGIPYPLFEGPSDQAREYCGLSTCSLCEKDHQHCFLLDNGCAVMLDCPSCGTSNGLDADDREDGSCRQCQAVVPFPAIADEEIKACYCCLRSGKAAITKVTELGMISWEQAFEGVTHGVPGLNRSDFEMVRKEDDWVGARLPQEVMFELLRTPTYNSIQGEQWQFCCQRPMVFMGEWSRDEFTRRTPNSDGQQCFEEIVQDCVPGLWEDKLHDITGVYVFQCSACNRVTAHWDIA
ncbi:MAG: CbrC family protein [Planctomycetales bacterium]